MPQVTTKNDPIASEHDRSKRVNTAATLLLRYTNTPQNALPRLLTTQIALVYTKLTLFKPADPFAEIEFPQKVASVEATAPCDTPLVVRLVSHTRDASLSLVRSFKALSLSLLHHSRVSSVTSDRRERSRRRPRRRFWREKAHRRIRRRRHRQEDKARRRGTRNEERGARKRNQRQEATRKERANVKGYRGE